MGKGMDYAVKLDLPAPNPVSVTTALHKAGTTYRAGRDQGVPAVFVGVETLGVLLVLACLWLEEHDA